MLRPFDALEQITNIVERESWGNGAEVTGPNHESLVEAGRRLLQPAPERVVDDFAKRPSRLSGLGLQLRGHIVVEGQSGSHILMLAIRHHDVNLSHGESDISPRRGRPGRGLDP